MARDQHAHAAPQPPLVGERNLVAVQEARPFDFSQLRVANVAQAPRSFGPTPEVLIIGTLLCVPALWTSIVLGTLPVDILLERYIIVLFGTFMVTEPLYWMGVAGRVQEPRLFDPELGHRFMKEEANQPLEGTIHEGTVFGAAPIEAEPIDFFGDQDFSYEAAASQPGFDLASLDAPDITFAREDDFDSFFGEPES